MGSAAKELQQRVDRAGMSGGADAEGGLTAPMSVVAEGSFLDGPQVARFPHKLESRACTLRPSLPPERADPVPQNVCVAPDTGLNEVRGVRNPT